MSRVDCKSQPLTEAETLRDRFAMAALVGLISHPKNSGTARAVSDLAYEIADAMMEARK